MLYHPFGTCHDHHISVTLLRVTSCIHWNEIHISSMWAHVSTRSSLMSLLGLVGCAITILIMNKRKSCATCMHRRVWFKHMLESDPHFWHWHGLQCIICLSLVNNSCVHLSILVSFCFIIQCTSSVIHVMERVIVSSKHYRGCQSLVLYMIDIDMYHYYIGSLGWIMWLGPIEESYIRHMCLLQPWMYCFIHVWTWISLTYPFISWRSFVLLCFSLGHISYGVNDPVELSLGCDKETCMVAKDSFVQQHEEVVCSLL